MDVVERMIGELRDELGKVGYKDGRGHTLYSSMTQTSLPSYRPWFGRRRILQA